jgi:hypothetical protein
MARHVVRAFQRMLKMRVVFRNQPLKPSLEVRPRGWIGVFHNHQAATRVLAKNRGSAVMQTAVLHFAGDEFGNLMQPFAVKADRMRSLMDCHKTQNPIVVRPFAKTGFLKTGFFDFPSLSGRTNLS